MKRSATGTYLKQSIHDAGYLAFIPHPLPPVPPLLIGEINLDLLERANRGLGRLDAICDVLPDPSLFLYFYIRKEAVLSSQIEGTQSSLSDLLAYESERDPGAPLRDVGLISNYVAALNHGILRIRDGFPLSLRLIREIHDILLSSGRGSTRQPGEFRTSQNWIGGSRPGDAVFVPPPPETVIQCMGDLEVFLYDTETAIPALMRTALVHAQFETIHPFLDGNGRVGRLLIPLLFKAWGLLDQPLLYISYFFKKNRFEYYSLLQAVRETGDWEAWISFFLEAVRVTSMQAVDTAKALRELFERDRHAIQTTLGRSAGSALRVHQELEKEGITTERKLREMTGLSKPTIYAALSRLSDIHIVREITGNNRNRLYSYGELIAILREGTDPIR